jgi:pimeloyl-ACP methyl ester carboxylesterase
MSGKPHDPDAYGGNHLPDDILAVMDVAVIERFDIMGYSMGVSRAAHVDDEDEGGALRRHASLSRASEPGSVYRSALTCRRT